jgi:hypothetical protein
VRHREREGGGYGGIDGGATLAQYRRADIRRPVFLRHHHAVAGA